jgi:hypothetical protein
MFNIGDITRYNNVAEKSHLRIPIVVKVHRKRIRSSPATPLLAVEIKISL